MCVSMCSVWSAEQQQCPNYEQRTRYRNEIEFRRRTALKNRNDHRGSTTVAATICGGFAIEAHFHATKESVEDVEAENKTGGGNEQ